MISNVTVSSNGLVAEGIICIQVGQKCMINPSYGYAGIERGKIEIVRICMDTKDTQYITYKEAFLDTLYGLDEDDPEGYSYMKKILQ
jgi:hypothetical protein